MHFDERTHILESRSMPDTPDSTRSDLAQLVVGSDCDEQADSKEDGDRTAFSTSSFNFISSILCTGIIAMPFAFKEAGFGVGILLVLVVTLLTDYSQALLVRAGEMSNTNTYQDVIMSAFGRTGFVALTIVQFLYPFMSMISCNIIVGDTLTKIVLRLGGPVMRHTVLGRREFITGAVALLVALPMALYRNVGRLVQVALLSTVFIVFVAGTIIARVFATPVLPLMEAWQFANVGFSQALGILAFAFMGHHKSVLVNGAQLVSSDGFSKYSAICGHAGVLFSTTCAVVIGITGYATFTGYTQGDIFNNYCLTDDLMGISRLIFTLTLILGFSIDCYVTRQVIENAVFAFRQPASLIRHVTITVIIVMATVLMAMTTDCVALVVQLNGALSAAPLAYIFPALCVLQLQQERIARVRNLPCILTALFGVVVSLAGLTSAIYDIAVSVLSDRPLPACDLGGQSPLPVGAGSSLKFPGEMFYCTFIAVNQTGSSPNGAIVGNNRWS